jgi:hypothetical protein
MNIRGLGQTRAIRCSTKGTATTGEPKTELPQLLLRQPLKSNLVFGGFFGQIIFYRQVDNSCFFSFTAFVRTFFDGFN